jgi:hypothetical protein
VKEDIPLRENLTLKLLEEREKDLKREEKKLRKLRGDKK